MNWGQEIQPLGERISLSSLPEMDRDAFVAAFGGVFEHSRWVAEGAWAGAPFHGLEELHEAMVAVLCAAPRARQLALIHAHPDLAGKAAIAGKVTRESRGEQAGAGLDRLTPGEYARFRKLNRAYRERFGFPFILAVKGMDKARILESFADRLENTPDAELDRCLTEIAKIARLRLADLVGA